MRSRWTLAVEGLGRIDEVDVEVRPLTLFVGENNSGKSYLASLLWDFEARMPEVFSFHGSEIPAVEASPRYQRCKEWLIAKLSLPEPYLLMQEDVELLLAWFNERLDEKKDAVVQRVFGRPGMTLGGIRVERFSKDATFALSFKRLPDGHGSAQETTFTAHGYGPGAPRTLEIEVGSGPDLPGSVVRVILITLLAQLISHYRGIGYVPNEYDLGDPVYLPASRTGFMLLYKGVLTNLIGGMTGGQRAPVFNVQLTFPTAHFLQLLAFGLKSDTRGPYAAEADLLERHAFPGTVALAGGVGVNEVEYRYDPSVPPLPMQLSSSLVTELAPLILVLRHLSSLPSLFLEEPEAHLHPRLVRLVAQVIARLIRKGVRICVTTHSPDFCQQINNFIKLGALPIEQRARVQADHGYEADDYLDPSEVAGYQFRARDAGRSMVARLAESPSGLAMPTFNEELLALSKQTLDLQRAVEGIRDDG